MQFVELGHIDIEILKYIYKNDAIHKEDILRKFPEKKYCTDFRIKNLLNHEPNYMFEKFKIEYYGDDPDGQPLYIREFLEIYELTEIGKKYFQDIEKCKVVKRIELLKSLPVEIMRSVFFPSVVALITTILASTVFKKFVKNIIDRFLWCFV